MFQKSKNTFHAKSAKENATQRKYNRERFTLRSLRYSLRGLCVKLLSFSKKHTKVGLDMKFKIHPCARYACSLVLYFISLVSYAQDGWLVKAPAVDVHQYAGVTVANGMLGVISSPYPFQVKEIVMAGAYDLYGRGRVNNMIRSFSFLNMYLEVNRHRIGAGNASNMKQELDMKRASFKSTFDFEDKVTVSVTYRVLRHLPHSVLMDVEVKAKKAFTMNTGSIMEAPDALRDVQNYYNEIPVPGGTLQLLTSSASSPSGRVKVCASNAFIFDSQEPKPVIIHEMLDDNLHQMKFERMMKAGETYRFSVVGSAITSMHHTDPLNEAERLTIFARQQGRERLIAMHEQAWAALWESDIVIEGDAVAQQDIRMMLYHLYSFMREDTGYSISPMGLSGLGYNGHVFWDTEIWMYPALLVLHPELARNMVDYRYNRLEAAKTNAARHGYKGAMFPWESAASGDEETPVWALSGPFEHHITACVGIAAWNYFAVTQDTTWLREKGWPLLSATAKFWASRVEKNADGWYDIKNVVGADEWAENVDNDAWTNAAAKANLIHATKAAAIVNQRQQEDWKTIAEKIRILKFESGVTREHGTYHGEPVKQADVNLLAYPLQEVTDPRAIRMDIDYYKERIPDKATPAMTKAIFTLLYARLGDKKAATNMFATSYAANKIPPFGVLAETAGGWNPYFVTGAGGVLQSVLMGFGGLRITDEGIVQDELILPLNWKSLTIRTKAKVKTR